jgi:hypothetical protein
MARLGHRIASWAAAAAPIGSPPPAPAAAAAAATGWAPPVLSREGRSQRTSRAPATCRRRALFWEAARAAVRRSAGGWSVRIRCGSGRSAFGARGGGGGSCGSEDELAARVRREYDVQSLPPLVRGGLVGTPGAAAAAAAATSGSRWWRRPRESAAAAPSLPCACPRAQAGPPQSVTVVVTGAAASAMPPPRPCGGAREPPPSGASSDGPSCSSKPRFMPGCRPSSLSRGRRCVPEAPARQGLNLTAAAGSAGHADGDACPLGVAPTATGGGEVTLRFPTAAVAVAALGTGGEPGCVEKSAS